VSENSDGSLSDSYALGERVHKPSERFTYPKAVIAEPQHPTSKVLIAHWRAYEAKGGMRMGRDVPSRAIATLLPSISICEPLGDWVDGRIRIAGSILTLRFGRDIHGLLVSELYKDDPDGGRILLENARRAQETRRPGLLSTRVCAEEHEVMRFEVVALPIFAADGLTQLSLVGTFRF
jgi:hypothetical protein